MAADRSYRPRSASLDKERMQLNILLVVVRGASKPAF